MPRAYARRPPYLLPSLLPLLLLLLPSPHRERIPRMSIPDPANTSAVRVTLDLPLDPAEVAHAQERDALAHAYTRVAQETMDSLSDDIPSDLRARVKQVVWDSTMRGRHVRACRPRGPGRRRAATPGGAQWRRLPGRRLQL